MTLRTYFFKVGLAVSALIGAMPVVSAQQVWSEVLDAATGDGLGMAISCRSDLMAVGAPFHAPSSAGQVVVYHFTSSTPAGIVSRFIPNPSFMPLDMQFGRAVLVHSDVNGDGLSDIIVGAPAALASTGQVFVFYDNPARGPFSAPANQFDGVSSGEYFGRALAEIDNVTGSSAAEIAVGSPFYISSGQVTLIDPLTGNRVFTVSPVNFDTFGFALAAMSDVSSDGKRDILVGAPTALDLAGQSTGEVVILRSSDGAKLGEHFGQPGGYLFGAAIASVGDVNADGFDDFIVGAPSSDSPPLLGKESTGPNVAATTGYAELLSGAPAANLAVLCAIPGAGFGSLFGSAVAGLGDVNGDGRLDFAVGSEDSDGGLGRVQVYSFIAGACQLITSFVGEGASPRLGRALAGLARSPYCSFNLDRAPDFAAGTLSDKAAKSGGSAVLYAGIAPTPTPTPTPTATPTPTPTLATPTPATPSPSRSPKPPRPVFPTRATLGLSLDPSGTLSALVRYDQLNEAVSCRERVYVRWVAGALKGSVQEVSARGGTFLRDRRQLYRAYGLPLAEKQGEEKPVLHMLVRTTCVSGRERRTLTSNVTARYMNCGGSPAIAPDLWVAKLKSLIRAL